MSVEELMSRLSECSADAEVVVCLSDGTEEEADSAREWNKFSGGRIVVIGGKAKE